MSSPLLYLLFFFSGTSGLIYQVIWVRAFGNVFGNTVYSASVVTAVFMLGLGLGSWWGGSYADRQFRLDSNRPLKAYAYVELGIGGSGLALAYLLPMLEVASPTISTYVSSANGWHALSALSMAARYALAIILLGPITVLMGATLTLLIRTLVHLDLGIASWRIGLLYGFNTAGAAAGALAVDFAFIPAFGLLATQGIAALLNFVAAVGALRLAKGRDTGELRRPSPAALGEEGAPERRRLLLTCGVLFCTGILGMGLEILWYRYLISMLSSTRAVFSLLLGSILVSVWLGSTFGGFVASRRRIQPASALMIAETLLVVSALLLMVVVDGVSGAPSFGDLSISEAKWASVRLSVSLIAAIVGIPAFLTGVSFPLGNALVQDAAGSVGRRAGALYLANTLGAAVGSTGVGFILLPALGMQHSLGLLLCVGAAAVVALTWHTHAREGGGRLALGCGLALAAALVAWYRLPADYLLSKTFRGALSKTVRGSNALLFMREGISESLAVIETTLANTELDPISTYRMLWTNGHVMSGANYLGMRYMRAFSHLPLLMTERPERVLVICFGVGNTLHAASLHPSVTSLEIADLSENILSTAEYFSGTNDHVLKDPRVSVFVNDGRQHLRMGNAAYDLITLEPPPISFAGVSSLYSADFYRLARTRLKPGGYMTQWLPAYQVPDSSVRSAVRAFLEVFPTAVLLSGFQKELILVGINSADTPHLDPDAVVARLLERPRVAQDLDRIGLGTVREMAGAFVAGPRALAAATVEDPPITDDFPILEYGVVAFQKTHFPRELIDLEDAPTWCPKCFQGKLEAPLIEGLREYFGVLAVYYGSEGFLTEGHRTAPELWLPGDAKSRQVISESPYLRSAFRGSAPKP